MPDRMSSTTANEIDVHVGQRMRQLRETRRISQGTLGRHLGLTFSQVQKYEKGANRIGAGRLFLIADFFGVPVQYFFAGLGTVEATAVPGGRAAERTSELDALERAFRSIPDSATRRSVIALVVSLAAAADPENAPAAMSEARRAGTVTNGLSSV